MTPRPPAVGTHVPDPAGRHAAPPRRGLAVAVVVAMVGIGAGTWFLGSGGDADSSPASGDGGLPAFVGVSEAPAEQQAPALPVLSVAPAPSEEAYAAARRASRSGGKDTALEDKAEEDTTPAAPAKKGAARKAAAKKTAAGPASTDLVAAG